MLKRWQWEHGLVDLTPEELEPFFAKVEQRVSVGPQDPESIGEDARIMQRGADRLGYSWIPAMRNQKHCCGANNCAFGCPTDAKQSVLVTYVPRLLAAGGRLFSGCKIERVTTDGQRATGVVGALPPSRERRARPAS